MGLLLALRSVSAAEVQTIPRGAPVTTRPTIGAIPQHVANESDPQIIEGHLAQDGWQYRVVDPTQACDDRGYPSWAHDGEVCPDEAQACWGDDAGPN